MADRRSLLKNPLLVYVSLCLLLLALILAVLIPLSLSDLRGVTTSPTSTPTVMLSLQLGEKKIATGTPAPQFFANLEMGKVQIMEGSSVVQTIEEGAQVLYFVGQHISSLTNSTFEIPASGGLVMARESVIELSQNPMSAIVLHQGRILTDHFTLTIISPDGQYQVTGENAVMGIEYQPDQGVFWVECLSGPCTIVPGEGMPLYSGKSGGYVFGEYRSGSSINYSEWSELSPGKIKLPTATRSLQIKPSTTPIPTLTPTPTFVRPDPSAVPTRAPTLKPTRTPYHIPGSQG